MWNTLFVTEEMNYCKGIGSCLISLQIQHTLFFKQISPLSWGMAHALLLNCHCSCSHCSIFQVLGLGTSLWIIHLVIISIFELLTPLRGYLLQHHDLGTGNIFTVHKQLYVSLAKHYHLRVFGYLIFLLFLLLFSSQKGNHHTWNA